MLAPPRDPIAEGNKRRNGKGGRQCCFPSPAFWSLTSASLFLLDSFGGLMGYCWVFLLSRKSSFSSSCNSLSLTSHLQSPPFPWTCASADIHVVLAQSPRESEFVSNLAAACHIEPSWSEASSLCSLILRQNKYSVHCQWAFGGITWSYALQKVKVNILSFKAKMEEALPAS